MKSIQTEKLDQLFDEAKVYNQEQLSKIYSGIAAEVMKQPPERMAQGILKLESPKVNEFIQNLQKQMKEAVSEWVVASGLSEAVASIIWAKAMNLAQMPTVSLCKTKDVQPSMPEPRKAGPTREQKDEINRLAAQRNVSIGVAATGLAVGVITCLIVPGWTGIAAVAKATKVASVIVVGAGTAGAVISQHKIEEINRIVAQLDNQAPTREEVNQVVSQVCKHQCKTNIGIINAWLDRIKTAVIDLCNKELAK